MIAFTYKEDNYTYKIVKVVCNFNLLLRIDTTISCFSYKIIDLIVNFALLGKYCKQFLNAFDISL